MHKDRPNNILAPAFLYHVPVYFADAYNLQIESLNPMVFGIKTILRGIGPLTC